MCNDKLSFTKIVQDFISKYESQKNLPCLPDILSTE